MANTTLTYDEFLSAVKTLEDEKKNVTYAAVRDVLGRGSMATLRLFFAQRNEEKFSAKHAEIDISENFFKAFKSEISRIKLADANLYKTQINSLQAELEEHGSVVLQYETALIGKTNEIEKQQAELADLRREFASEQAKFSQAKADNRDRIEELVKAVQKETDQKNKAEADCRVAQALQVKFEHTTAELKEERDKAKAVMTQLTEKLEQQGERLTAKYEAQVEKCNTEHKAEKQVLQDELRQLWNEVAVKENVLKEQIAELKEREANSNQKNAVIEAELRYLKESNEDLGARLAGAKKYFDKLRARDSAARLIKPEEKS